MISINDQCTSNDSPNDPRFSYRLSRILLEQKIVLGRSDFYLQPTKKCKYTSLHTCVSRPFFGQHFLVSIEMTRSKRPCRFYDGIEPWDLMGFCRLATLATPGAGEHHSHIRRKIDAAIPQLLFSLGLWLLESFCGLTLFGTAELYKSNDWQ
jgi:hypothetical protein